MYHSHNSHTSLSTETCVRNVWIIKSVLFAKISLNHLGKGKQLSYVPEHLHIGFAVLHIMASWSWKPSIKTYWQSTENFSEMIVLLIVTVIQYADSTTVWCYQIHLWPWNQESFCLASTPSVHQKCKIAKVSCHMLYWVGSCPKTICSPCAAGSFGCGQLLHCPLCVNLSNKKNWKKLPGPLSPPHLEEQLVSEASCNHC